MQKSYNRINWENYPSDKTPLNEVNLNRIDVATDEIDNRVITLDTTKFDKTEAQGLFKDVSFDRATGIITFTLVSGATKTIDTLLEKIAVNFDYDVETQQLIITLDDGTIKYIDLSALITQYEFLDSDTIAFSVDTTGKVAAIVKEGSIEEKHLQPNYLADIKVEVAKAQASQTAAATSEANALASENAAKKSETNAKTSETNAKASETSAASSASTATAQATAATNSATAAATSASTASAKATEAVNSATSAASSASTATSKASAASTSAANAENSATEAESYAHGRTGTRENEDIDNAQYYYQQSKSISESFSGALRPMGTVTFANLPSLSAATEGDMYNVSDQFTTNANFKEGSGLTIPAGANVYKTADGYWDVLAGSPVTGVKGNAESSYRKGNVNITPEDIGAVNKAGDTMNGNLHLNYDLTVLGNLNGQKNSTAHSIILGHNQKDYCDFYEYGGIFNFYKGTKTQNTLLGRITENGWEGKVEATDITGETASINVLYKNNDTDDPPQLGDGTLTTNPYAITLENGNLCRTDFKFAPVGGYQETNNTSDQGYLFYSIAVGWGVKLDIEYVVFTPDASEGVFTLPVSFAESNFAQGQWSQPVIITTYTADRNATIRRLATIPVFSTASGALTGIKYRIDAASMGLISSYNEAGSRISLLIASIYPTTNYRC